MVCLEEAYIELKGSMELTCHYQSMICLQTSAAGRGQEYYTICYIGVSRLGDTS